MRSMNGDPLHWAAHKLQTDVVKLLIDAGAGIHRPASAGNNWGGVPLHYASVMGHTDVVRLLIKEGADPNKENYLEETPIILANKKGHNDVVKILLKAGAEQGPKRGIYGFLTSVKFYLIQNLL